jgi:hypothetical protein
MPIPQIILPSVKTRPAVANAVMKHAGDVEKTAGGDRMSAVPKRSAMSPRNGENAPISSIASALANDHNSRPTLRSAAIGF